MWAVYHCKLLPPGGGSQYLQNSSKMLCVSLDGELGSSPRLTIISLTVGFSLVSHPLPYLINNYLNLPFGKVKGRSRMLDEINFL